MSFRHLTPISEKNPLLITYPMSLRKTQGEQQVSDFDLNIGLLSVMLSRLRNKKCWVYVAVIDC